jgi:ribosomal protein L25 (general stress protein Ctc)
VLARALSRSLDEYFDGQFVAVVYGASTRKSPISFDDREMFDRLRGGDDKLLALGLEFDAALAEYRAAKTGPQKNARFTRLDKLANKIGAESAATVAGFAVKLQAVCWDFVLSETDNPKDPRSLAFTALAREMFKAGGLVS